MSAPPFKGTFTFVTRKKRPKTGHNPSVDFDNMLKSHTSSKSGSNKACGADRSFRGTRIVCSQKLEQGSPQKDRGSARQGEPHPRTPSNHHIAQSDYLTDIRWNWAPTNRSARADNWSDGPLVGSRPSTGFNHYHIWVPSNSGSCGAVRIKINDHTASTVLSIGI